MKQPLEWPSVDTNLTPLIYHKFRYLKTMLIKIYFSLCNYLLLSELYRVHPGKTWHKVQTLLWDRVWFGSPSGHGHSGNWVAVGYLSSISNSEQWINFQEGMWKGRQSHQAMWTHGQRLEQIGRTWDNPLFIKCECFWVGVKQCGGVNDYTTLRPLGSIPNSATNLLCDLG